MPLVYSNPKLFPAPAKSDALVSHVDFLPTLASLAAAPQSARAGWEGVDYSKLVLHPSSKRWKLAKYYDVKGEKPPQWEMYDLSTTRSPGSRRPACSRCSSVLAVRYL